MQLTTCNAIALAPHRVRKSTRLAFARRANLTSPAHATPCRAHDPICQNLRRADLSNDAGQEKGGACVRIESAFDAGTDERTVRYPARRTPSSSGDLRERSVQDLPKSLHAIWVDRSPDEFFTIERWVADAFEDPDRWLRLTLHAQGWARRQGALAEHARRPTGRRYSVQRG